MITFAATKKYVYIRPYCANWDLTGDYDLYGEPFDLAESPNLPHPDCILAGWDGGAAYPIDNLGAPIALTRKQLAP